MEVTKYLDGYLAVGHFFITRNVVLEDIQGRWVSSTKFCKPTAETMTDRDKKKKS